MPNSLPNAMSSRLATLPRHAFRIHPRTIRSPSFPKRHQSTTPSSTTTPQPTAPARTQQAQTPLPTNVQKHPSSVSHPALREQSMKRGNDNTIFLIFGGLLLGGIPLSYWYWGYRERAMRAKKEEMLRGIQERYAARHGSG